MGIRPESARKRVKHQLPPVAPLSAIPHTHSHTHTYNCVLGYRYNTMDLVNS